LRAARRLHGNGLSPVDEVRLVLLCLALPLLRSGPFVVELRGEGACHRFSKVSV